MGKRKILAVLVYQLPQDLQREALDNFPAEHVDKAVLHEKGLGLEVYFKDFEHIRSSVINRQKIEVGGTSYRICRSVTDLTVYGIRKYVTESQMKKWVERWREIVKEKKSYAGVIDQYAVQGSRTSSHNDLRLILDIPEILAHSGETLMEVGRSLSKLGRHCFQISFFCRFCRQNGHQPYRCPKYFLSEPHYCHASKPLRRSFKTEGMRRSPSTVENNDQHMRGYERVRVKTEPVDFPDGGQFLQNKFEPAQGYVTVDNIPSTSRRELKESLGIESEPNYLPVDEGEQMRVKKEPINFPDGGQFLENKFELAQGYTTVDNIPSTPRRGLKESLGIESEPNYLPVGEVEQLRVKKEPIDFPDGGQFLENKFELAQGCTTVDNTLSTSRYWLKGSLGIQSEPSPSFSSFFRHESRSLVELAGYTRNETPSPSCHRLPICGTNIRSEQSTIGSAYEVDERDHIQRQCCSENGIHGCYRRTDVDKSYHNLNVQGKHSTVSNANQVGETAFMQKQYCSNMHECRADMDESYDNLDIRDEHSMVNNAHEAGEKNPVQRQHSYRRSDMDTRKALSSPKDNTESKKKEFEDMLSTLLPPHTNLSTMMCCLQILCSEKPKDVPSNVYMELKNLLRWNSSRDEIKNDGRTFLDWLSKKVTPPKRLMESCHRKTGPKHSSDGGTTRTRACKIKEKTNRLPSCRWSLSEAVRETVLKTEGVLTPSLLCKYLYQVRGRRALNKITPYFTRDISTLVEQLNLVVQNHYRLGERGGKEENNDIQFIKNLRKRLLSGHAGNTSTLSGASLVSSGRTIGRRRRRTSTVGSGSPESRSTPYKG